MHLRLVRQNQLLLNLLSLKCLTDSVDLNKEVFEGHPQGALFSHQAPPGRCQGLAVDRLRDSKAGMARVSHQLTGSSLLRSLLVRGYTDTLYGCATEIGSIRIPWLEDKTRHIRVSVVRRVNAGICGEILKIRAVNLLLTSGQVVRVPPVALISRQARRLHYAAHSMGHLWV